jgi:tetratricopeptide (TPR) repeat protein
MQFRFLRRSIFRRAFLSPCASLGLTALIASSLVFAVQPNPCDKLTVAAVQAVGQGRYAEAEAMFRSAIAAAEQSADRIRLARGLNDLASLLWVLGDLAHAEELYRRGIPICEDSRQVLDLAWILSSLGSLYADEAQYNKAAPLFDRALSLVPQDRSNDIRIALTLENLAHIALETGQYGKAESMYRRAIATGGAWSAPMIFHKRSLSRRSVICIIFWAAILRQRAFFSVLSRFAKKRWAAITRKPPKPGIALPNSISARSDTEGRDN